MKKSNESVKESFIENKLRQIIRESIRELMEGRLQTQFQIPTREQRNVMEFA